MSERYWTHEEIVAESAGLMRALGRLEEAAAEIEGLPSVSSRREGERPLPGEVGTLHEALTEVRSALSRPTRESDRACDAAESSHLDEAERHNQALWDEWEERGW
jgi:hypothetical protein